MTGQVYSGGQRLCHNAETPVWFTVRACGPIAASRQEIEDLAPFLENKTLSLFGVQPRETLFIYFL